MEGNESSLSSYYHHLQPHHHHHHQHQQQHQQHHTSGGAISTPTAGNSTAPNGIFSSHHHNAASSGHYSTSEGTPLIFPPHSVTGRAPVATSAPPETVKRKRGRPRKYGTSETAASATPSASSAKKVSATSVSSLPLSPSSSPRKKEQSSASSALSPKKAQLVALGHAGQGFTPHVITVAAGEDVAQKIMSFMQQHKRAVCILSASGSISNASLRQPATLGGNVTYEGRFEILSLTGSFLHSEVGGASSRTGGLSVCLSGSDGRIVGGGVGGPLKAAGPVQVIVGSFVIDTKREVSGGLKADASTSKLPSPLVGATISNLGFGSSLESSGRIPVGGSDEHQNISPGHFMLQPRGMHVLTGRSTDWRSGPDARNSNDIELRGRADRGACQSPVDGEDDQIRL
ncbi:AT-hook motif nuclear-localized protein 14 [Telopea speciosissima]|uniref:AT-hook motif nuclear-localized protein 14 n=1 Tax=Telopea speciosissima TaxID=54955 RepID=UPI001CC43903|nr:AT-hook motif nuclear-localized protein 14 [Telopea speciosissima]XP_043691702.1 AT-hook motif nuclear-localized protein 14 [Telopea speciosissima]